MSNDETNDIQNIYIVFMLWARNTLHYSNPTADAFSLTSNLCINHRLHYKVYNYLQNSTNIYL